MDRERDVLDDDGFDGVGGEVRGRIENGGSVDCWRRASPDGDSRMVAYMQDIRHQYPYVLLSAIMCTHDVCELCEECSDHLAQEGADNELWVPQIGRASCRERV